MRLDRPLVMGILNVTPDSFADGGKYLDVDAALTHVEQMINEGADIIDVGGESTRPGSAGVSEAEELERVVPVIAAVTRRFDIPISIDTTKSGVARRAIEAGAEIVNDISGLRFDEGIADAAAEFGTGLVLMHSRGAYETLHQQPPVDDILEVVRIGLCRAIDLASAHRVSEKQIVLDPGIGFGKTREQNLELLQNLGKLATEFANFPILVGTSRKSFLTKILGDVPPAERLGGSLATGLAAVKNGAKIIRVHDVNETVSFLKRNSERQGTSG